MRPIVLILFFIIPLIAADTSQRSRRGGRKRGSIRVRSKYHWLQNNPYEGMVQIPAANQKITVNGSEITLRSDFFMDRTEVTQEDYFSLMKINRSSFADNQNPVENVSWFDAVLYCNARSKATGLDTVYSYSSMSGVAGMSAQLSNVTVDYSKNGYRLPSEAEWEFAYRAGSNSNFYWGEQVDGEFLWYRNNSYQRAQKVGQKAGNWYGLYDMAGNVAEWCGNNRDNSSEKLVRGGSWYDGDNEVKATSRQFDMPSIGDNKRGFRCVAKATINLATAPAATNSSSAFEFLDSDFFSIDTDVSLNQNIRRFGGLGVAALGFGAGMMVNGNINRLGTELDDLDKDNFDNEEKYDDRKKEIEDKISSESGLRNNLYLLGFGGVTLSVISLKF